MHALTQASGAASSKNGRSRPMIRRTIPSGAVVALALVGAWSFLPDEAQDGVVAGEAALDVAGEPKGPELGTPEDIAEPGARDERYGPAASTRCQPFGPRRSSRPGQ